MSLLFHFTEQLVNRYPEAGQDLTEELPRLMEENLGTFSFSYKEIICDGFGLYIESDFTPAIWDPVKGKILEFLDETMKDWGIKDIGVYCDPVLFYGIAVDYQYWDGTLSDEQRNVWVLFEVVAQDAIEPFLNPEKPLSMACRTLKMTHVFDTFRREGIHGENFMQMKSELLGKYDTAWIYIELDNTELQNINISNWYELKIYRLKENVAAYMNESEFRYGCQRPDYEPEYACSYRFLDESVQDTLQELCEIAPSPDTEDGQSLNWIQSNTEFGKVEIFNAGQALCVGIYELFGYEKADQNRLAAFFDFGIPYTAGRPRPNAAPDYQTICNEIADFVNGYGRGQETRDHIHIVLSHWHLDHCILALKLTTELAHTVWHVPCEGLGLSAQKIRSHIVQYGGKVYPVVGPVENLPLEGNENLQYGKIDYGWKRNPNPAIVRASRHPHHHGMYLIVQLESGKRVFLSGDCTYAGINGTLKSVGFDYLQASHHGGNYALPPAARTKDDIPRPAGGAAAIYSCGPYSEHHHPDQASINEHTAAGWKVHHVTHNHGGLTIQ